jgi:hypothetical protein
MQYFGQVVYRSTAKSSTASVDEPNDALLSEAIDLARKKYAEEAEERHWT